MYAKSLALLEQIPFLKASESFFSSLFQVLFGLSFLSPGFINSVLVFVLEFILQSCLIVSENGLTLRPEEYYVITSR